MNTMAGKSNRGLKHYEYAGGYISYDPSMLTEHYESIGYKGNDKSSDNLMANSK